MKVVRQTVKPVSLVLAIFMLWISGPSQSALGAMIGTDTVLESSRGQEARMYLKYLLAREDVQRLLLDQGVEAMEAKARIDSLTDAEAIYIAEKVDQLPAGSGVIETIIIVALIIFLVLLFTDIAGYTDIFPFVK